ncbi:MAG: LamG-like jellyroll fold domain-containing protein [Bacteroidota bacterium]
MKKTTFYVILLLELFSQISIGQTGQVAIPRVEMMPNQPTPYNVRNWKEIATDYDAYVFDLNKTGTHLPLIHINPSGINYPQMETFRLHTYVGTNSTFGNEAINVLPTLVGSSLVGIDKRDQFGRDWILMSQDFYNKANGENLYLNNAGASSGNDWWYDMMPNVFFYQLYDLYPNIGDEADLQFNTIANRMLEAVHAMGGDDAPWEPAYMNYRAWKFKTMEPNDEGVPEPEAAGAFAWLLYHAYKITGDPSYLKGAEWSIEFLDEWTTNPSYELQLPYGTYTAAKMNAELGTTYDIEKMVNWSFDRGPLRGWGTIVGNWNNFDVSGLVGEANDNGDDYAFQLNGMQQAAALVPMVRYDKRFARAIGKWVLNLANASRLFFHGFLPTSMQDGSDWSESYDPDKVIGYEALREKWQGISPFSTGDALGGGWAATNLALYGTSSVGYLGAIVEKTDVEKILKIDLLSTDFYRRDAYPSYLFYNSHSTAKEVQFDAGNSPTDIYDALSETFVLENVSGQVSLTIQPDEAISIVVCPAGGEITYDKNKMLVNGVVVDFAQQTQAYTFPPRFKALATAEDQVETNSSIPIYAAVSDPDSDQFTFQWSMTNGNILGAGDEVEFTAPSTSGNVQIQCIVSDNQGNKDTASVDITVVETINQPPHIIEIQKSLPYAGTSETVQLTCIATDDLTSDLTYEWSVTGGTINGTGSMVEWTAPASESIFEITVTATDEESLTATANTSILVRNFQPVSGNIIADYPFNGNTDDVSGNNLHGQSSGAILTVDQFGIQQSAYYFNGGAQHIEVENDPLLNFQDGITVSCWFKANALPDKETFLLSHGSWQNRWKVSITPTRHLRWTVNSLNGISDLDAIEPLEKEVFYHIAVTYDGSLLALYLDGQLNSYKPFSGQIRTTSFPFLIGQMLPDEVEYNFKGVIDEVKINDYALTPTEVNTLYENVTTAIENILSYSQSDLAIYPNPSSQSINISWPEEIERPESFQVIDSKGQLISIIKNTAERSLILDISDYKPGKYLIVGSNQQTIYTGRFLKQ